MTQIFNLGSINWDHCYQVSHFVRPGETLGSRDYVRVLGGKGANQSVALARAGANVRHIGALHQADQDATKLLAEAGVDTAGIALLQDTASGHAIIQITPEGENAILLFAGANKALDLAMVEQQLAQVQSGDWLLLQNETNLIVETIALAKDKGLKVAFNPAPMDKDLTLQVLPQLDLLIVNEVELQDLTGATAIAQAEQQALAWSADLALLVTLGSQGVKYFFHGQQQFQSAFSVEAVDTTAAGDTFIGYFLAAWVEQHSISQALIDGCAASALCVTKAGAIPAIPSQDDVDNFLEQNL